MLSITVHLLKPGKGQQITYQGELLRETPGYRLIRACWDRPTIDLGYVVFATGDLFFEHYYAEQWFNVFQIESAQGQLKGWYCNVTRPAVFTADTITSEDLELDLFVPPARDTVLRLDLDEFAARGFAETDPALHQTALATLDQLEQLARASAPPFDGTH